MYISVTCHKCQVIPSSPLSCFRAVYSRKIPPDCLLLILLLPCPRLLRCAFCPYLCVFFLLHSLCPPPPPYFLSSSFHSCFLRQGLVADSDLSLCFYLPNGAMYCVVLITWARLSPCVWVFLLMWCCWGSCCWMYQSVLYVVEWHMVVLTEYIFIHLPFGGYLYFSEFSVFMINAAMKVFVWDL